MLFAYKSKKNYPHNYFIWESISTRSREKNKHCIFVLGLEVSVSPAVYYTYIYYHSIHI